MVTRLFAACLFAAVLAVEAGAAQYVVDQDGLHDFTAIGPAVEAAADGDTVIINPGTYTGALNRGIVVNSKNLVVRSSDGPNFTTIDGEGAGRVFYLQGAAIDSTTRIEGLTITHAWARSVTEDGGPAITCYDGTPVIEDCRFVDNEGNYAGAVKILYGDAIVRRCVFRGNAAVAGGALHSAYCSPTVTWCTFTGNTASESGGAFRAFRENPVFRNCTFAANSSAYGGCLQFDSTPVAGVVERCIIAFDALGRPVDGSGVTTSHSIVYGNAAGDSLYGTHHDNHFADPLFCGMAGGDVSLCANSWGLIANNTWGVDVGRDSQGCLDCASPADAVSWGRLKALFRP